MDQTTMQVVAEEKAKPHPVTIKVNGHSVTFQARKATGLEIKQTAMAQHVPIQEDFALFRVNPGGHLKQIPDAEIVELHEGEAFRAVTPDDNSQGKP